jgi:hypothetical protein
MKLNGRDLWTTVLCLGTSEVYFEETRLSFRIFRFFSYRIPYSEITSIHTGSTQLAVNLLGHVQKQCQNRIFILLKNRGIFLFLSDDLESFLSELRRILPNIEIIRHADRTRQVEI